MPFSLLPAIDVTDGRLGRYRPEGPIPVEVFGGDPVAAATAFAGAGADWLHVVDMDLAFAGEARNAGVVRAIAEALPEVRVQASGGIVTPHAVDAMLEAGASRVVLGSGVLDDPERTRALVERAAGRAVVGVEVAEGRIRARGRSPIDLDLMPTLGWLALTPGVRSLLVTSVSRVGKLEGPDVDLVRRVMRRGFSVLAAGGIRSLEDLGSIRAAGAAGAVLGRAALEGAVDLAEAFAWARV